MKIEKIKRRNSFISNGKITSSAEYRTDKQFENLLIFEISILFQNEQYSEIFLIFQVEKIWKFVNFPM